MYTKRRLVTQKQIKYKRGKIEYIYPPPDLFKGLFKNDHINVWETFPTISRLRGGLYNVRGWKGGELRGQNFWSMGVANKYVMSCCLTVSQRWFRQNRRKREEQQDSLGAPRNISSFLDQEPRPVLQAGICFATVCTRVPPFTHVLPCFQF